MVFARYSTGLEEVLLQTEVMTSMHKDRGCLHTWRTHVIFVAFAVRKRQQRQEMVIEKLRKGKGI